jgi:hypothetical protein
LRARNALRTAGSAVKIASAAAKCAAAASGKRILESGMDSVAPFDVATALAQGISLNHKGLHVDASRVLNDGARRARR